ncbi:MAG TPA: PLP-dependent aminotransferase family protein [Longimicrobiales bacterium]
MLIRLRGSGPLHERLYQEVRGAVLSGRARAGERLPSTRGLAEELGVSRTVVIQAYDRLLAEGYLTARVGAGTFVAEGLPSGTSKSWGNEEPLPGGPAGVAAKPRPSAWAAAVTKLRRHTGRDTGLRLDFRYGRPSPEGFPSRAWRRALSRAGKELRTGYGDPRGSPRLREALAAHLARSRAVVTEAERIVLVTGSQQALDLVARVVLAPGDAVLLEEPHYQGARQVFQAAGGRLVPTRVDDQGLVTEGLPGGARMAYVTPSHQFPLGGVLPLRRRLELLAWASREDAVVVEDDYDSEYRHVGAPVEAVQALDREGRILYLGTLSKVLFPALRAGYLVLPEAWVETFAAAKWLTDRHSPTLEQEALAIFIGEGHFERHLRRTRRSLGERRGALLDALDRELAGRVRVEGADAGMHVVVWLDELPADRVGAVVEEGALRGVGLYAVAPYYLEPPERAGLVLGYASLTPERIRRGVSALRAALDAVTHGAPEPLAHLLRPPHHA